MSATVRRTRISNVVPAKNTPLKDAVEQGLVPKDTVVSVIQTPPGTDAVVEVTPVVKSVPVSTTVVTTNPPSPRRSYVPTVQNGKTVLVETTQPLVQSVVPVQGTTLMQSKVVQEKVVGDLSTITLPPLSVATRPKSTPLELKERIPSIQDLKLTKDKTLSVKPQESVRTTLEAIQDSNEKVKSVSLVTADNKETVADQDTVEVKLINLGYMPLANIVVKNSDGQIQAEYVKAVNVYGQTVYVQIDSSDYVTASPNDLTVIKANIADVVPYNVKMGNFDCTKSDVCGIAYDCSTGLCVVSRAENTEPSTTNFVVAEKKTDMVATTTDSPVGYAIVKLSEIMANPQQALKLSRDANIKIRQRALNECEASIKEIGAQLRILKDATEKFIGTRGELMGKLEKSLKELEAYERNTEVKIVEQNRIASTTINPTVKTTAMSNIDLLRKNQRTIVHNLRVRNEMIDDMLGNCKLVDGLVPTIKALTTKITEVSTDLSKKIVITGQVVNP